MRCLAFVGPMLACGDFGGTIHTWEIEISPQTDNAKKNPTFKVFGDPKLKYYIYPCLKATPSHFLNVTGIKVYFLYR